jgi:DNA-binding transcriptional ArsR family regulator
MLRIHATNADLLRTRIAGAPDPLWELVLSLYHLRRPGTPLLGPWRRATLDRLRGPAAECLGLLLTLVPAKGYCPDFLTPADAVDGFDAGIEAIMRTPKRRLRDELGRLCAPGPIAGWAEPLARGDREALDRLAHALRTYYAAAIEPFMLQIRASVHIDRSRRARSLADGGYERLLTDLRPMIRWREPFIEAEYPFQRTMRLDGRGLVLVPSFFCTGRPITVQDPRLPPVLVCPVESDTRTLALSATVRALPTSAALADLVGRTRGAVLEAIGEGCTTGDVARRLGISLASASEHTGVLRRAGLLVSVKDGITTLHMLTPIARALLGPAEKR